MGYPMTWKRVKARNSIINTDVDTWKVSMPTTIADIRDIGATLYEYAKENVDRVNIQLMLLRADIARLELDAIDEAEYGQTWTIARNTGIDPDVVATVIRHFLALP